MTRYLRILFAIASLIMTACILQSQPPQPQSSVPAAKSANSLDELASLRAEVNMLKEMAPDQSHVMTDVAYHFSNLWFAGEKTNWPIADFYWSETRSHLRWAVRIIPVRKDPQGKEIRLTEILDPIEKSSLQPVGDAIHAHQKAKFEEAYKQMLASCYSCHVAVGKPFLQLQIPRQPEAPIINFEPAP